MVFSVHPKEFFFCHWQESQGPLAVMFGLLCSQWLLCSLFWLWIAHHAVTFCLCRDYPAHLPAERSHGNMFLQLKNINDTSTFYFHKRTALISNQVQRSALFVMVLPHFFIYCFFHVLLILDSFLCIF